MGPPPPPGFFSGLAASRGCAFACAYCAVPRLCARRVRWVPVAHVLEEVAHLRSDLGVGSLFFHDAVFGLHAGRTLELCEGLAKQLPVLPYSCQTRVDCLAPRVLDAMASSGCGQVMLGIETGSPETARRIHKELPEAQVREAVRSIRARGMRCAGFFMVGFPWEDREHLLQTRSLALDLELDYVHLFSATPLPGSELGDALGGVLPAGTHDFRTPWMNFSSMSDACYSEEFEALRGAFDAYNHSRIGQPRPREAQRP
jgi:anaerobic magnesium-protoporphyrin IX monomethyl ester cyclase